MSPVMKTVWPMLIIFVLGVMAAAKAPTISSTLLGVGLRGDFLDLDPGPLLLELPGADVAGVLEVGHQDLVARP